MHPEGMEYPLSSIVLVTRFRALPASSARTPTPGQGVNWLDLPVTPLLPVHKYHLP